MATPVCSIDTRSRLLGSFKSNTDVMRRVTVSGARANATATTTGMAAISRKSLRLRMTATAMLVPTQAPRPSVRKSATMRAGNRSAGHMRSREPNTSRASTAEMPSIRKPENVM